MLEPPVARTPILPAALAVLALGGVATGQDYRLPPEFDSEAEGIELTSWLSFKPYVRLTSYYNNNIFQESGRTNEQDWVTRISPGFDVVLEGEELRLELGYAPSFLIYAENSSQNDIEHRLRFNAEGELRKFKAWTDGFATWGVYNTDPQFNGRVRNFTAGWSAAVEWQPTDLLGAKVDGGIDYVDNFPDVLERFNSLTWRFSAFGTITPNLPWDLQIEAGGGVREILYYDHAAINPDLTLYNLSLGGTLENKLIEARVRLGYEWGYTKKRRAPTSRTVSDGLMAEGELAWKPQQTTKLTAAAGHQIGYSLASAYQRNTWVGGRVEQKIPNLDLIAFGQVMWRFQEPLHAQNIRAMYYSVGVGWSKWEQLELGAQVTYTKAESRLSNWEVLTAGLSVTLRY